MYQHPYQPPKAVDSAEGAGNDDRRVRWLAKTECGEVVYGRAYRSATVPGVGEPVKCGHRDNWSAVTDVVTSEPLRDSSGSLR